MISLAHDQLEIRFPGIGDNVGFRIEFQRTLRIPTMIGITTCHPDWGVSRCAT